MTAAEKALISLVTILVLGFAFVHIPKEKGTFGSVTRASEYQATTTKKAVTGAAGVTSLTVLSTGPCTLGSVIITGANTGIVNFYDATSTVTNTEWATTTIATIPASAAAGTYTFDAQCYKGLMYELVGTAATAPTSTITYR